MDGCGRTHSGGKLDRQSAGASHLNAALHLRSVAFDGFLSSTEYSKEKKKPHPNNNNKKNTKVNVCVFDRPCCGCRVRKIIFLRCAVGERIFSVFLSDQSLSHFLAVRGEGEKTARRWWMMGGWWGSFATTLSRQACHLKTDTRPWSIMSRQDVFLCHARGPQIE